MKSVEAQEIINLLKTGKKFYTRHQEQMWGIDYIGLGRFQVWTQNYIEDKEIQTKNESGIIELLKIYNYENILKGIS